MRTFLVLLTAAIGLCACVSDVQRQAAMRQCESVGLSQKDGEAFSLCTRSYTLQANQDNLEVSYHRALNPTYEDRRIAHQWHGF